MRPLRLSVIAMAAGLLMSAPAFAQTSPGAEFPQCNGRSEAAHRRRRFAGQSEGHGRGGRSLA